MNEIKPQLHYSLLAHNTFGIQAHADCFIQYTSVEQLLQAIACYREHYVGRPLLHIGGGSNLLFTDDFKGTILHSKINFIEILEKDGTRHCEEQSDAAISSPVLVSVGAGVVFDDFCDWAAKEGLWGVENLSYIPGEVGASAVQNIGAYGVEVKDVIKTVYCYDTVEEEFVSFDVEECEYGYRDSIFKDPEIKGRYIVTHVVFALSRTPQPRLEYGHLRDAVMASSARHCEEGQSPDVAIFTPSQIRKVIIKIRKEKLPEPSVMGSAGSFFKNPVISAEHFARIEAAAKAEHGPDYKVPHYVLETSIRHCKLPAAWLIEQCGWKGKRSGGAAVYDKQPLVIVNYTGDAYPEEIIGLERRIIASVKSKFDIDLHPEVEHI